jgi:hypothetical protein
MNNNKIEGAAKGTANGDVVTVENINDHNTSPFAHADIRNLISAIQGAYIYRGVINENTINVTQINLNERILVLMGRAAILGDVLTDLDRTDWYYDGTSWDNMGQTFVVLASAVNDGLMSKEDFTKLSDLYTKAQIDSTFVPKTDIINDLTTGGATKPLSAEQGKALQLAKIDKFLNQPIGGGLSLNQLMAQQLVTNGDFSNGTTGFTGGGSVLTNVANNLIVTGNGTSVASRALQTINVLSTDTVYMNFRFKTISHSSASTEIRIGGIIYNQTPTPTADTWYQISSVTSLSLILTGVLELRSNYVDNATSNGKVTEWDYFYIFNTNILKENKQYSPLYQTTFDLMTDAQIKAQMDYWIYLYQTLTQYNEMTLFSQELSKKANITQEAWITPTLTNATTTYLRYRKDTLGTVIIEGNLTVTTTGTNFTLPTGYRPLFTYVQGDLTFNTDGTVVSATTGLKYINVRYTGA